MKITELNYDDLIDKLDGFLEMRITAEMDKIKADLVLQTNVNELLKAENLRLANQRDILHGILERMAACETSFTEEMITASAARRWEQITQGLMSRK